MVQLEWKTALVTGSSRGIGRGIVRKLVDAGIERVAVNYFANDAAAHETAEMLKGKGAEVLLIKADCIDADQVRGMFDQVKSEFGSLDNIARARELITTPEPSRPPAEHDDADVTAGAAADCRPPCPCCGGRMIIVETFERGRGPRDPPPSEPRVRAEAA